MNYNHHQGNYEARTFAAKEAEDDYDDAFADAVDAYMEVMKAKELVPILSAAIECGESPEGLAEALGKWWSARLPMDKASAVAAVGDLLCEWARTIAEEHAVGRVAEEMRRPDYDEEPWDVY